MVLEPKLKVAWGVASDPYKSVVTYRFGQQQQLVNVMLPEWSKTTP